MSLKKGLTTWIVRTGNFNLAYRWNMTFGEAIHTFRLCRGRHHVIACGPILVEW